MRGLSRYILGAVLVAISLTLVLVICGKSYATTNVGPNLTTSPVSLDMSVKPGHTETTTLLVHNNGLAPEQINVRLDKFKSDGLTGQPDIFAPESNDPSVGWVRFSQNSFVAQPGEWHSITMTISPPSFASLGYYYAVLFEPQITVKTKSADYFKDANAVLILLNTNTSNEKELLMIQSFTSDNKLYQYLPAKFNVIVKNLGNIHLIPEGDIYISRAEFGKSIETLPINKGNGNVLPDSSREFQAQWADGFPVYQEKKTSNGNIVLNSKGKPEYELKWNLSSSFSKIRIGKYWAHAVLVYNNGNVDVPIDAYLPFWVIPWELILVILAVILIVGGVFVAGTIRMNRKIIKKIRKKKSKETDK